MSDIKEAYSKEKQFWNQEYAEMHPQDLRKLTLTVEPTFDACLYLFGEQTKNVLDYGTGTGDILFQLAQYFPDHRGLGVDISEEGIRFAAESARLSEYDQYRFLTTEAAALPQMKDSCFDGIILSNVLDVMPDEEAHETVAELNRLLAPGGYWLIKLNPFYSSEELENLDYDSIGLHMYVQKGVLRLRQESTLHWFETMHYLGKIERFLEFEYPWQEGLNRLFLVRKQKISPINFG